MHNALPDGAPESSGTSPPRNATNGSPNAAGYAVDQYVSNAANTDVGVMAIPPVGVADDAEPVPGGTIPPGDPVPDGPVLDDLVLDERVLVDPVLGDHDHGEYVSPGMADAYRRHLLPLADGLTPNGFELARLSGMPVDTFDQVAAAARTLLTGRTQWIAVTSAAPATWAPGEMLVALVTRTHAEPIRHPRIDATPKGTGDLFCAGLTARWLNGASLPQATQAACQEVVRALRLTKRERCAELLLPPAVNSGDE